MKWVGFFVGAVLGAVLVTATIHQPAEIPQAGDYPCVACW